MFRTTPESINERLPQFDNASRACLTADARIDNRDELIDQLQWTGRLQTDVTDGELLKGVRYRAGGMTTHSLVMRSKSGTIRIIESHHQLAKLRAYSAIDFEGSAAGRA